MKRNKTRKEQNLVGNTTNNFQSLIFINLIVAAIDLFVIEKCYNNFDLIIIG